MQPFVSKSLKHSVLYGINIVIFSFIKRRLKFDANSDIFRYLRQIIQHTIYRPTENRIHFKIIDHSLITTFAPIIAPFLELVQSLELFRNRKPL